MFGDFLISRPDHSGNHNGMEIHKLNKLRRFCYGYGLTYLFCVNSSLQAKVTTTSMNFITKLMCVLMSVGYFTKLAL